MRTRREFFIVGPTAVGKSGFAVDLAEECGAEIVNADAFQIYRGLDILTAKPDKAAQRRVRHHLLGTVELSERMSAARFRELASDAMTSIAARNKQAIVVSGSGLYVKALTDGFDKSAPPDEGLRAQLAELPLDELGARLQALDPELAARTDLKNRRRVVRAIEIAQGRLRSHHVIRSGVEQWRGASSLAASRDSSTSLRPARDDTKSECGRTRGVLLLRDRDDLYARINERVETLFCDGVVEEVAALKEIGPTASQALGLREIGKLLAGEISQEECIATIQQKTRRYAKRQLTWFRHQTSFRHLNLTALSYREAVRAIMQAIALE